MLQKHAKQHRARSRVMRRVRTHVGAVRSEYRDAVWLITSDHQAVIDVCLTAEEAEESLADVNRLLGGEAAARIVHLVPSARFTTSHTVAMSPHGVTSLYAVDASLR